MNRQYENRTEKPVSQEGEKPLGADGYCFVMGRWLLVTEKAYGRMSENVQE
ncbi:MULTISPECIES: hypothetical protein [Brevibacillus]|uniref:hypothetical protein n=1 Tax=Brevibacillus TaxID=55080 RepID=UPI00142E2EDE|nr:MULTISPECIES: hypothetical protein [Brevibacillus]MDH6348391.1 hypothetical protein [Brevibacillus sp. 1238]MDR5000529.1 hypothetical protein [Brevibacillus parabrevis]MED2256511.1 hypothetical protein [Brevibacillus parabrevis]NRQ52902.1 hypothetical protein [Brevibacillus sp. HD1.4A]WDV96753.1 hypothetical protein PSE45_07335 [Brevibacillus parabrevis]